MLTRSWKPVICEENPSLLNFPKYRISKLTGEIRRIHGSRALKPHFREADCARISLSHEGKRKNILVHRAYLLVFHGPPPLDAHGRPFTGDHINNNHLDNSPANLRWSSIAEQNTKRCIRRKSVRYIKQFELHPHEKVLPFPSRRSTWAFTSRGRVIFNGKLRVGGRAGRDGYSTVKIDGKQYYLHRVIAHLFMQYDMQDPKNIIMHVDHVKENCCTSNLRIGTHRDNMVAEVQRRNAKNSLCESW